MERVWQIGAGAEGRDFSWLYKKHDLMLIGGGRYGEYDDKVYSRREDVSALKLGMLSSFVKKVQAGDIVVMRLGHRVLSIGVAHDNGYLYNENFDDVYGWDLQHTRRIIWQEHLARDLNRLQKSKDLLAMRKQIPTFTRLKDEAVLNKIRPLFGKIKDRPLKRLPNPLPASLTMEGLGQELFSKGLPNNSVDAVIQALERQRRLVRWYLDQDGTRPREHEVVAHLIIPILLALGWSEQLLAVEWHNIDLAGFYRTPRSENTCALLCEAKGLRHGLQGVLEQATGYVSRYNLKNCHKILLAGGSRFYLHQKKSNRWSDKPAGYINLEKIRTNHIAPPNTNAVNTIMALTPAGVMRKIQR